MYKPSERQNVFQNAGLRYGHKLDEGYHNEVNRTNTISSFEDLMSMISLKPVLEELLFHKTCVVAVAWIFN